MKVHLFSGDYWPTRPIVLYSFCGLPEWMVEENFDLSKVTCKTCLKAHATWLKRREGK